MSENQWSKKALRERLESFLEDSEDKEIGRTQLLSVLDAADWSPEELQKQISVGDFSPEFRFELAEVAGALFGRPVHAEILLNLASAPGFEGRILGMEMLGYYNSKPVLRKLLPGVHRIEETALRRAAVQAIKFLDDEAVIPHLIYRLVDPEEAEEVRSEAAEALGGISAYEAAPIVRDVLGSEAVGDQLKFWTTYALGVLGDTRALPALLALTESADDTEVIDTIRTLREEARWAIEVICRQPRIQEIRQEEIEEIFGRNVVREGAIYLAGPICFTGVWQAVVGIAMRESSTIKYAEAWGRTRSECALIAGRILLSGREIQDACTESEIQKVLLELTISGVSEPLLRPREIT